MGPDPKRTAAAVLSLVPGGKDDGEAREPTEPDEDDTEMPALEAAASEVLAAVEARDAGALARAFRAAFRSMGG